MEHPTDQDSEEARRDRTTPRKPPPVRPTIVCLCGSTRFPDAFRKATREETLARKIVLSVGFFSHSLDSDNPATPEQKVVLDELHFRKIDLADEILILNVGGYVGESLTNEIRYAAQTNKVIRWLEKKIPIEFQDLRKDPVHRDEDGKWYFWEETWADRHGPFETAEQAREELTKYAKWLTGGPKALRPDNYNDLSAREQWDVDKRLGILDEE